MSTTNMFNAPCLLFVAPVTVQRHAHNLYEKLGVHGRLEAVAKATDLGILSARGRIRKTPETRKLTFFSLLLGDQICLLYSLICTSL